MLFPALKVLPPWKLSRAPFCWAFLAYLPLGLLAGYGLDVPAANHMDFRGKDVTGAVVVWLGNTGPRGVDEATYRRLFSAFSGADSCCAGAQIICSGLDSLPDQLSSADDQVSGEDVGSGGGWVGV